MPLAAMAGIGLAGSIGGALIGSNSAKNAANAQADAANHSADLQYRASQDALNFQKQQWGQSQSNMAPWLNAGKGGLSQLQYMLGLGSPQGNGQPGMGGMQSVGSPYGTPAAGIGGIQGVSPGGSPSGSPIAGTGGMQGVNSPLGIRPVAMGVQAPGGMQSASGLPQLTSGPAPGTTGMQSFGASPTSGMMPATGGMQSGAPSVTSGQPGGSFGGMMPSPDAGSGVNPNLGGFGSLMQAYGGQFNAPTDITMQNDPGYQARLKLGTDAVQRSAAARGNILTGGTAQALNQGAQDYASNEYGNVYNRALTDYTTKYNAYNNDQTNQYNKLAALAGLGQQSATQLAQLGQGASNNVSNNLLSTAQGMGNAYQNAGAASASGYVGAGNAWSGALGNTSNNLQQLMMLRQLQYPGGSVPQADMGIWGGL